MQYGGEKYAFFPIFKVIQIAYGCLLLRFVTIILILTEIPLKKNEEPITLMAPAACFLHGN